MTLFIAGYSMGETFVVEWTMPIVNATSRRLSVIFGSCVEISWSRYRKSLPAEMRGTKWLNGVDKDENIVLFCNKLSLMSHVWVTFQNQGKYTSVDIWFVLRGEKKIDFLWMNRYTYIYMYREWINRWICRWMDVSIDNMDKWMNKCSYNSLLHQLNLIHFAFPSTPGICVLWFYIVTRQSTCTCSNGFQIKPHKLIMMQMMTLRVYCYAINNNMYE